MTGNDIIENERRRKNNGKLLKFVFVAIIFFLLGSVIFLTVHCTKIGYEKSVLVATAAAANASNGNNTGDGNNNNNTMTINTSKVTLQQKFSVDSNRLFNDHEILMFELLMQAQTTNFFIASNTYDDICPGFTCSTNDTANDCVNETIQSNCTVTNRNYNESDCNYNGEDIKLHFIISYTSSICNVTYFPEIFQNYTNGHHNKTLDNFNLFKMNSITNIDKVRRVSNSSITSEMTNTTP